MTVLITGASRGLGIRLAEKFAREGHEVIAAARSLPKAERLAELAKQCGRIHPYEMDVSDWGSVSACAEQVGKDFPAIDVLVNNAGVLFESDKVNRIMDVEVEALFETIAVNVEGPILVLKAFYPLLQKSERPRFYVITSESTMNGHWYGMPVYSLSKVAAGKAAGIIGASVEEKFQVLAIHPGRMDTDMGHASAQIQPEEAAEGIWRMAVGLQKPESWYVDYLGRKMEA